MATSTDYTQLITSEHADKPNFVATVELLTSGLVEGINNTLAIPPAFDLDIAVGDQLDTLGLWVGLNRSLSVPVDAYFALDVVGFGFDQGNWKGPDDPSEGLIALDDDTYRLMIRAKIGANNWDGSFARYLEILTGLFTSSGTSLFVVDHQDMTVDVCLVGVQPSILLLSLLTNNYLALKPEGVLVNYLSSFAGTPIFGFDISSSFIDGFDSGSWATLI